jgi:hypothetical protein
VSSRRSRDRDELALGRPVAEHDRHPRIQVSQALEQELRPRPGRVPPMQQPVVEAEHRHDALAAIQSRPQGGVVVDPQVPCQPQERRHRASAEATARAR